MASQTTLTRKGETMTRTQQTLETMKEKARQLATIDIVKQCEKLTKEIDGLGRPGTCHHVSKDRSRASEMKLVRAVMLDVYGERSGEIRLDMFMDILGM